MECNKCSRCGSFYITNENVCPKCCTKDGFEFSTFKSYIEENGFESSLDIISGETGITVKNLNRFLEHDDFKNYKNEFKNDNNGFVGINFN